MVFILILIAILLILTLALLALFLKIEIKVIFENEGFDIKIIILKFIKIDLKDKTKTDNRKKDNIAKIKTFLNSENREHIKAILSESDIHVDVNLIFGTQYPHETAFLYGIINTIIYTLEDTIKASFKTFESSYKIYPDFKNKNKEYKVTIRLYTRLRYYLKYKIKVIRDTE